LTRPLGGLRAIVLDIEGTTTPISFVYQTLFPYARNNIERYLRAHGRFDEYPTFISLMEEDSKSTALKELQGRIWEEGYRSGELVGAVFDDVPPALARWRKQGIGVGIFSSGSVLAQKLLFQYSSAGDLTPFLRWHFDTTIGTKTDPESYRRIASTIGEPPSAVLFVSDIVRELDAARAAGMQTVLSVRPGNATPPDDHGHSAIRSFEEPAPNTFSSS
jgi:enolase-phosphatase E1